MVSCDILCRDNSLQASSIEHVTRRRHPHVSSGRARRFQPHTTHAHGREGVRDRHFLPPPRSKCEKKVIAPSYTAPTATAPLALPLGRRDAYKTLHDCWGCERMKAAEHIHNGASTPCGWGDRGYASGWCK
ncbi:hypothetical protein EVAR_80709_1 [Eumeta japonica]|uniref:Uncharacterized protein n=1 Tax=Eumeta variegata TaxID=151549 RepID=A0A4C1U3T5_EUMVA|nr:hypothetical protein EVAR_80709_1 [Eumeta japonica]